MSTTVRISDQAHHSLKKMASEDGVSLTEELDRAVETLRRQRFYNRANEAYSRVREDDQAWEEIREERTAWDETLADQLDEHPYEGSEPE